MIQLWKWIKNNPNRAMFLVPIILVAIISISHVVTWYDLANPINWAIYLSIAIEIAAMTALVAATSKVKGGIWLMFGLVTFIQVVGNVFFCYKEIDETSELFKSWVELTYPVWEMMGTDVKDVISMKRWLAFMEGGLLPIISLTSLHFFVNYNKREEEGSGTTADLPDTPPSSPETNQPIIIVEEEPENTKVSSEEVVTPAIITEKEGETQTTEDLKEEVINKNIRRTGLMETNTGKIKQNPTLSKNIKRID